MKATINRKTYNTETAEELARFSHGYPRDLTHWSEVLYKTAKGNYFLYGQGGAMSRYSESSGDNNRGSGRAIIPMNEKKALEWCESHECQVTIDKHFDHLIEEA